MSYIKKKSKAQEVRTAKEFRGKTTPASGAMWAQKADVRTGDRGTGFNENDYLIENKFTDADTYKLERKIWEKIAHEALRDNMRIPLIQVDLQDLNLVIMDYNTFLALFEEFPYKLYSAMTNNKSYLLDKLILKEFIDLARVEQLIPAFDLLFTGKVVGYKQLRLIIMTKDDFFLR